MQGDWQTTAQPHLPGRSQHKSWLWHGATPKQESRALILSICWLLRNTGQPGIRKELRVVWKCLVTSRSVLV